MRKYTVRMLLVGREDVFPSISKLVEKYGQLKGITTHNLNYHFGRCKKNEVFINGIYIKKEELR